MFTFLSNLFASDNSMSFYKLYTSLRKWQEYGSYPSMSELPEKISFPTDFWERVERLYKQTRNDGLERAISLFWADGDLILSSDIKGNKRSVSPKSKVIVRYSPSKHQGYLTKEVLLDDRRYSKKDVYYKSVPKKIEVKYLFNMHTHPPHNRADGSVFYTFFSAQDIKSLIKSKAVITGMIGDKLWILFRTNRTPNYVEALTDAHINMEFLYQELHIAIYYGEFRKKLVQYKP